jgi:hypothetical protein
MMETAERERRAIRLTGKDRHDVDKIAPKVPAPEPYGDELTLFDRVRNFLMLNVILPDEDTYNSVTAFAILTWRTEDISTAPYIYITAPKGHGKTKVMETLLQICRRAIPASYATRAGITRAVDGSCATLLLDEAEKWLDPYAKYQNEEIVAILNAGNRRGSPAIMVEDVTETDVDGKKRSVKRLRCLDAFGLKVIASRKDIFDTLEDRAIQIVMPKSSRSPPPLDEKEAETLRAMLLQYRLDALERKQTIHPYTSTLTLTADKNADARLLDILTSLYAVTPEKYQDSYERILQREVDTRQERLQETYEYKVLDALSNVVNDTDPDGSFILTDTVTENYNINYPNKSGKPTRSTAIGRVLMRLGFKAQDTYEYLLGKRIHERGYLLNRKLLDQLKDQYLLSAKETPIEPSPSVPGKSQTATFYPLNS